MTHPTNQPPTFNLSVIRTREALCPYGFVFYDDDCISVNNTKRATIDINVNNVPWSDDYLDSFTTQFHALVDKVRVVVVFF